VAWASLHATAPAPAENASGVTTRALPPRGLPNDTSRATPSRHLSIAHAPRSLWLSRTPATAPSAPTSQVSSTPPPSQRRRPTWSL